MSIASWAAHYRDSTPSDYSDAPLLLDGNTSTGYTVTGAIRATVGLSMLIDLCSAQTAHSVTFTVGYEDQGSVVLEYTNDSTFMSWSNAVFHPLIAFATHGGVYSSVTHTNATFAADFTARYIRLSLQNADASGVASEAGGYEYYVYGPTGAQLGCVSSGNPVFPPASRVFNGCPMSGTVMTLEEHYAAQQRPILRLRDLYDRQKCSQSDPVRYGELKRCA